MKRSDEELDHLLARGHLGGPAREGILADVLAARAEAPIARWRRWRNLGAGLVLASTAALSALVLWPGPGARRDRPEFESKGAGSGPTAASAARIEIACLAKPATGAASDPPPASLDACPVGATLLFGTTGLSGRVYLEAYAAPKAGGERIWYFSAENETPLAGAAGGATRAAQRGIRLGREHQPGVYEVHAFATDRPARRADLLAPPVPGLLTEARFDLKVVAK